MEGLSQKMGRPFFRKRCSVSVQKKGGGEMRQEETISAIATPPGVGGIGIVRLSGETALSVAAAVFRPKRKGTLSDMKTYEAAYGHIVAPDGETIDEAIALVMRSPHSYTMEDVVELQCHGGGLVLQKALSLTLAAGARLAQPGEFTKRAFLNGRLDLAEAGAVMEVVSARTGAALRAASGRLAGRFSGRIRDWRQALLALIAHLEAVIDFPEDDIGNVALKEAERRLCQLAAEMERLLRTADAGRVLREGLLAAIIGRPNVGKSSLLNALLREERAIVTDIPGTTRDSIEEIASIGGIPLRVVDTAGIRDTDDVVERIGVERARQAAAQAALVLALFDGSRPLSPEDEAIWEIAREKDHILLFTKSDLPAAFAEEEIRRRMPDSDALRLSTKTGEGMEALSQRIVAKVYGGERPGDESLFLADVREADLLRQALASLAAAREAIESGLAEDFIVIDLRAAWEKLGEIVGETVGEDIIDEIFRRFCLGK